MGRFQLRPAVLRARADKKGQAEDATVPHRPPEEVETQRYRLEEGDGSSHAQKIVRELYFRYEKQLQRWRDYRNLFLFLVFVALFLAVLYTQRSSNIAYQVHSTLEDVVVPNGPTMQSTDDVYNWLGGVLQAVWQDPVCGDGVCESPWEFASYSTFGCRADCGKLQDVQNLTQIQIDLYWDFSHPIGSIPSSDLMQQASWNLCPQQIAYGSACYYDSDQTFTSLANPSGTSIVIQDCPDGQWDLVVKRDFFDKVQGAVRDYKKLYQASYYYKVYIAATSVVSEMNNETALLQQAATFSGMTLWEWINMQLSSSNSNSTQVQFQIAQMQNAVCGCGNTPLNGTTTATWGDSTFLAFNNSIDPANRNQLFPSSPDAGKTFVQMYCSRSDFNAANPVFLDVISVNISSNGTQFNGSVPAGVNYTTVNVTVSASNVTAWCMTQLNNTINWRTNLTTTMQQLLVDKRIGNVKTTGKIAARIDTTNNLRNYLITHAPELVYPIFNAPAGVVALQDPVNAGIGILQDQYIQGVTYTGQPQPAAQAITRKTVYTPNITTITMGQLATARINETQFQKSEMLNKITIPSYPGSNITAMSINTLIGVFNSSGANITVLPAASALSFSSLNMDYNLVAWSGNISAYMVCNLPQRGPQYVGTCVNMNVSCVVNTGGDASVPYNCTDFSTNLTVPGNLSFTSYRLNCELPCDRLLDCTTLCECYGTCSLSQICTCAACQQLSYNAAADSQFLDITASSQQSLISGGIADVSGSSGTGRKLQQTSTDITGQLTQVLTQVGQVKTQQDSIASQMTTLQAQVDKANQLAQQRANDNTLIDLISAGRADIAAGQARVEAKLDEIIGKQNQSLIAAQQATSALAAIQGLAEKQLAAQQALQQAVQNQLAAIKTAAYQNIITLTQALALWKRARRDQALTLKAANLTNLPCTSVPNSDNIFELAGNDTSPQIPRNRVVGLTNRVIGGMLIHQFRTNDTNCTDSKFSKIQQTCTGPITLKPFGVDPVFKMGTTLYDPDKADVNNTIVLQYYNCSLLDSPTYYIQYENQTVNKPPYCAELYDPQGLPYSFYHIPLDGKEGGFPFFFDINLGNDGATQFLTYMQEGLYLDTHTRSLTAEMVTYNAPLRIFGYFYSEFFFSDGGSIIVTYRLYTVRVELYNSPEDDVRFAFEIILSMWIFGMLLWTIFQIVWTQKETGNFLRFFTRSWNIVDFLSNALLTTCMIIWWIFVTHHAKTFDIQLHYDVYADLTPDANFLALADDGTGLINYWSDVSKLKDLIDLLNWYFALNGINILLLIARVLKLMDFQPRLGVVTRSLWLAGPDLIHFAIVAGMVFVGYAMMAHLIFGNAIQAFDTFGDSVNTCFEILLGNIDVNTELRQLGGLQSVAGALFFWSYELLVFMVLLNFLLAIIVDAFSEVKEKTHETVGIHTELYQLLRDKWRSLLGSCSSNYISDAKLGELLKQWAGEDGQGQEENKNAAEVKKLLTVLNEDLEEDDLRTILMECLKDAPGAEQDDKASAAAAGGHCLPGRRKVLATPHDVEQAAKYIVDRFGIPVEAEEHREEDEELQDEQGDGVSSPGAGLGGSSSHGAGLGGKELNLDKERDQLAQALERLADVQRELADGQRNLMVGQKHLAEQQAKLVALMAAENTQD